MKTLTPLIIALLLVSVVERGEVSPPVYYEDSTFHYWDFTYCYELHYYDGYEEFYRHHFYVPKTECDSVCAMEIWENLYYPPFRFKDIQPLYDDSDSSIGLLYIKPKLTKVRSVYSGWLYDCEYICPYYFNKHICLELSGGATE